MMNQRRDFIKSLAVAATGLMASGSSVFASGKLESDRLGQLLPLRMLGKTGRMIPMLGVGGFHIGHTTERDAQETIEAALEGGIRFFDTAESYQKGESETRYGKFLTPKYRDDIFLMTKSTARDKATALKHLEGSLRRLKTDYVDLWQVHSLENPADVDGRIENGILEAFLEAKEKGKVKHIGFTGHANPFAHKQMMDRTVDDDIFACTQMPVNVLDPGYFSFIEHVLPVALKRNIGVLAMKTLADGRFFSNKERGGRVLWSSDDPLIPNHITMREALYFVWSLPVSVALTGAESAVMIKEKIKLVNEFSALTESERLALVNKVADMAGNKIEYYKKES